MTAAECARHFHIPAPRIRKWISRGIVTRNDDGTVNVLSLIRHLDPRLAEQITDATAA